MRAGIGLGFAFVPVQIAAFQGVPGDLAGVASGVITTSQQVGGAFAVGAGMTVVGLIATLLLLEGGRPDPGAVPGAPGA